MERGRFPKVTLHDNVRLRMLINEKLETERRVAGHGFPGWARARPSVAAQFPDMVRAACPTAGSARPATSTRCFSWRCDARSVLDPAYAEGFYERGRLRV